MRRAVFFLERLEGRKLFSAGFTPAQIETAYGFNQISFNGGAVPGNGAGQTIALIEVGNDPTLNTDLNNFDAAFGLNSPGNNWTLTVEGQTGGAVPTVNSTSIQTLETALDIEWAHAIAPAANITVVEANTGFDSDLNVAVKMVKQQPGVSVVSTSYTREEFSTDTNSLVYSTPANHAGITFVAAAGDTGQVTYPAANPSVLGVGGTSLTLGANNAYGSETVWNNNTGASGGGTSQYWSEPSYQSGVQNTGFRTMPDVSYDGDPNTGFQVYVDGLTSPIEVGGTSAGAPQWAALIAIADQGRELNQLGTLNGATQTLPMLYDLAGTSLYDEAFHDITTGSNGTFAAGPGYDEASGLGSPQANVLVQYLAGNISVPEPATLAIAFSLVPLFLKRPTRERRSDPHI
jgi:subtilase family serine protease